MGEKKHILMVDDVATNLKCAAEIFKDYFRLSMEKSGESALLFLKQIKPDLVILDINMPNMNGYEFLECMKADPDTAQIPVVFLTSDSDMESEIKSLRMGAMDYIRKPFEPQVMLSRIEKIFEIEDTKKQLSLQSSIDSLTGMWDRKYFEDYVNSSLAENSCGAFLLIDLDNFKIINDTCGHLMGDEVLRNFCHELQSIHSEKIISGRLGGDEFAVFIKGKNEFHYLREMVAHLHMKLNEAIITCVGQMEGVGVSMGLSVAETDGKDFLSLYHKADKALYFVKQNGKQNFHFFKENDDSFLQKNRNQAGDIGFLQLKKMFEEPVVRTGAYQVETESFKSIFQFITRSITRTKQNVQMILFTLEIGDGLEQGAIAETTAMKNLEKCIGVSLRRGDVQARFSNLQVVVILMDATSENASMVAERIAELYKMENCGNHELIYEIDMIKSKFNSVPLELS